MANKRCRYYEWCEKNNMLNVFCMKNNDCGLKIELEKYLKKEEVDND